MALSGEIGNYMNAIKSKPIKDIEMSYSDRRKAFLNQGKRCAKCKKDLNPNFCKYIKDPTTKETIVVCSNCAIPTGKR